MEKFLRSINWVMLGVYSLLTLGTTTLLLYFTIEFELNPALFFLGLFGTMGAIAMGFFALNYGRAWRWLAIAEWVCAGFFTVLFMMIEDYLHPALGISLFFFTAAAVVFFLSQKARQRRERRAEIEFQPLGALNSGEERLDALTPSQRDHAPINKR